MGIRLKRAETAAELDDVFWVRRLVYTVEEGKFTQTCRQEKYLADRFDAHPQCANLIAYDSHEPIATIRVNIDNGRGLPADDLYDFTAERARIDREWRAAGQGAPVYASAGMLAIRRNWRRRRDVIRSMLKLATTVGKTWNGTHVLVAVNHDNVSMYKRFGFVAVGGKTWNKAIGNAIVPMVATVPDTYARTVGHRLDDFLLLKCFHSQFQRMVFRSGETLFREFDDANECYVIDRGRVRITKTHESGGRELLFAMLGPGDIFGEMALIDAKRRSASATADTDTEVICLRRDDFMESVRQDPAQFQVVLGFIADRLRRTDEFAKLLAYGSTEQRLEFALKGYIESVHDIDKRDGSSLLRVSPSGLAAAAGADESEAVAFLDTLRARGHCEFTDKHIRLFVPSDSVPDQLSDSAVGQ